MMNALHLIWIIPAAAAFGFTFAAVLVMTGEKNQ